MKVFYKVCIFCVAVIGLYTLFATHYIPPLAPAPPPEEVSSSAAQMTTAELIALGERVFNGKGGCALCHDPALKRAPVLGSIASVAAMRLKDKRYKGKAADPAGYIMESMTDPSVYVVEGYGVTGSKDTASPMPAASSAELGLTEAEMRAITEYLLNSGRPGR